MQKKVRLAFLLDSIQVSAWQYKMIEILIESEYANVVAILSSSSEQSVRPSVHAQITAPQYWVYNIYIALDRLLFQPQPNAFELRDMSYLIANTSQHKKSTNSVIKGPISLSRIDELQPLELDILVNLSDRPISKALAGYARFGVWYFQHSDITKIQSNVPGFWETIENHPATGSALLAWTKSEPTAHILAQSWASTDYYSPAKNRNEYYWKTLFFLPRKVQELYRKGCSEISGLTDAEAASIQLNGARIYSMPTNGPALVAAFKQFIKLMRKSAEVFFKPEHWFIMFKIENDSKTTDDLEPTYGSLKLRDFQKIMPPKNSLWADPFFVERDGKYYLFIEDLPYESWKGFISLIEIDQQGKWSDARKILETDYHLSYPFIFEWQEEIYMIPESHQNKTIELYKCTEFPDKWEFQMNLMEDIIAVDATLFSHDNRWWLFAGYAECDGIPPDDELFLFYADQPITQDWVPHPLNPVVSDIHFARPAGPIFKKDGKIIRPSQDSSEVYGYGLNFQEIEILSETDYKERTMSQVKPTWERAVQGIHTYISKGQLTVVDAMMYRSKYW